MFDNISNVGIIGFITSLIAGIGSAIFAWRYLLIYSFRLRSSDAKIIYEEMIKNKGKKFTFYEEIVRSKTDIPKEFRTIVKIKGWPFIYLDIHERMLTAGWKDSTDQLITIKCLRWKKNKLKQKITNLYDIAAQEIPVYFMSYYDEVRISNLDPFIEAPIINHDFLTLIEKEIKDCLDGKINKTGLLLYGEPGNGKTTFVRYIATKFKLPIRCITFRTDYENSEIVEMFARCSQGPGIILIEDIDSIFDKRKCLIGGNNDEPDNSSSVKFSFDAVLNALDGVYCNYKQTIFIITANDINKIDDAIRYRPSRIKISKELKPPTLLERTRILKGDAQLIEATKDSNLDTVFAAIQMKESGYPYEEIMNQIISKENN